MKAGVLLTAKTDQRFQLAGVGVKPDHIVAETLGLTRNAVSQYRHRRGIRRPVCEARTRIVREPKVGFYVFTHKGTGARMVSLFPDHKGITLTRFFTECRIGRTLHRDEVAMASGVIRRLPNWGFRAMHARRNSERFGYI